MLAVFLLAGVFPGIETKSWSYNCRVCEARKEKKLTYLLGVPVWIWRSSPKGTSGTEVYESRVGARHAHEWCGGGYTHCRINLLVCDVGCGACRHGPYPAFQGDLTRMALEIIKVIPQPDVDTRRKMYFRMITTTNYEEYTELCERCANYRNDDPFDHSIKSSIVPPDWVTDDKQQR